MHVLLDEVKKQRANTETALELEAAATHGDDARLLQRAVDELSPLRVKGGKAAVESWRQKIQTLKSLVQEAEQAGLLLATIDTVAGQAQETISPSTLQGLYQQGQEAMAAIKRFRDSPQLAGLQEKLAELQQYVKYKKQYLEHFEATQSVVFTAFPLTQEVTIPALHYAGPFDNLERLSRYLHIGQTQPAPGQWLLTLPTFDPTRPACVPAGGHEPPLHRQVVFSSFLEAQIRLALSVAGPVPGRGLPGTPQIRRGVEAAACFLHQWDEISRLLPEVLDTFFHNAPLPAESSSNAFLAMCVLTHLVYLAGRAVLGPREPEHAAPDAYPREVALAPRDLTYLLLAMWPSWISAILKQPSHAEAAHACLVTLPTMLKAVPYLTLEASAGPLPADMRHFATPEAHLFFPARWHHVNVQEKLWLRNDFMSLCHRSPGRARIAVLVWAVTCLDPEVIRQLWSTLRPLTADESDTASGLLRVLVEMEFGPPPKTPRREAVAPGATLPPYPYGLATGERLVGQAQERSGGAGKMPVSGFEIVLGALLFRAPLRIFSTASTHRISDFEGGFQILTPLLDCCPDREPFASLAAAPRRTVPLGDPCANIHTPEEIQIFARQAAWLQYTFANYQIPSTDNPIPIVVLNANNNLENSYIPRDRKADPLRPFYVVPLKPQGRWPEIMTTATTPCRLPTSPEEAGSQFARLLQSQVSATWSDIFSRVPERLAPNAPQKSSQTMSEIHEVAATPPLTITPNKPTGTPHVSPEADPITERKRGQQPKIVADNMPSRILPSLPTPKPREPRITLPHALPVISPPAHRPSPIPHLPAPQVTEPKGVLQSKRGPLVLRPAEVIDPRKPVSAPITRHERTALQPPRTEGEGRRPPDTQPVTLTFRLPPTAPTPATAALETKTTPPSTPPHAIDISPPQTPPMSTSPHAKDTSPPAEKRAAPVIRVMAPTQPSGEARVKRVEIEQGLSKRNEAPPLERSHRAVPAVTPRRTVAREIRIPPEIKAGWDTAPDIPLPHSSPESSPPTSPQPIRVDDKSPLPNLVERYARGFLDTPSVEVMSLENQDIALDPGLLTRRIPSVVPMPHPIMWSPIVPISLQNTDIDTAKITLISFIRRIKQKVAALSASLAETVDRIKKWYL